MAENKNLVFSMMMNLLKEMKEHPESVSEEDKNALNKLYSSVCKATGTSEHVRWCIDWCVEKWNNAADKIAGVAPYEVVRDSQNIILDNGANEMLKLICGTGGTAYNSANAQMYVGTDTTAEAASQTGVIATGSNRAYASMDSGYPTVSGRTATFRASFGEGSANFVWAEASIVNGTGANSIAMNRKVSNMGTKSGGVWTLQMTVSLVSA
jgi:hypothetical protein